MTKAKATKLDKEIQEGLYDPSRKLDKEGYYVYRGMHLNVNEKTGLSSLHSKDFVYLAGIAKKLLGIDVVKNNAEIRIIQEPIHIMEKQIDVILDAKRKAKLYDPKKPATIYVITDAKGNKKKVGYAVWLKWMKEQRKLYDPITDKAKGEFKVVSNIPKNGFLLRDGTSLDLSEHADILRINLNQNQFMKRANAMRVESYRDEYVNVQIDVSTIPTLAQWNALSKFPKIFYDFTDGKTVISHGIVFSINDLKSAWRSVSSPKGYDPKSSVPSKKQRKGLKIDPEEQQWIDEEIPEYARKLSYEDYERRKKSRVYDPIPPTRWYEAMVKGIKKSSDVRNPYAIVRSIWDKLSPSKRLEIKAREAKGEQFKYDLPLPVDKPTRGIGTVRMVKPFKLAEVQVNLSVKDYLAARASGLFQRMKRQDGTTALVARCKSPEKNVNVFVDKVGSK